MSEGDLDAIRNRLLYTTQGPWEVTHPYPLRVPTVVGGRMRQPLAKMLHDPVYGSGDPTTEPNAEFIAHAPADIAALLAEVERLRALHSAATGQGGDA